MLSFYYKIHNAFDYRWLMISKYGTHVSNFNCRIGIAESLNSLLTRKPRNIDNCGKSSRECTVEQEFLISNHQRLTWLFNRRRRFHEIITAAGHILEFWQLFINEAFLSQALTAANRDIIYIRSTRANYKARLCQVNRTFPVWGSCDTGAVYIM